MALAGIKANIQGRVQGVYFRKHTRKKALALGLLGWVQNEEDGSVSLEAFGEETALEQLKNWLKKGPILARVDKLQVDNIPFEAHDDFKILQGPLKATTSS